MTLADKLRALGATVTVLNFEGDEIPVLQVGRPVSADEIGHLRDILCEKFPGRTILVTSADVQVTKCVRDDA